MEIQETGKGRPCNVSL